MGCRKAFGLLKAGAEQVKMVAPSPISDLELELETFTGFIRLKREFQTSDLDDCLLVFAATSDPELNKDIALLCKQKKCLCNVCSNMHKSHFILPALLQQNQISVAVSTQGASPSLAQQIRNDLYDFFLPQYQTQVGILNKLRPLILELGLPSNTNKNIFKTLATAPFSLFAEHKQNLAEYLNIHLPSELSPKQRESIVQIVANSLENT